MYIIAILCGWKGPFFWCIFCCLTSGTRQKICSQNLFDGANCHVIVGTDIIRQPHGDKIILGFVQSQFPVPVLSSWLLNLQFPLRYLFYYLRMSIPGLAKTNNFKCNTHFKKLSDNYCLCYQPYNDYYSWMIIITIIILLTVSVLSCILALFQ